MKKEKKEKDFLHKPTYPGGIKAIRRLIREQLQYPEAAQAAGVEGTVYLRYTIDHLGKVIAAKVISGLGYGCDEEALRLVYLLQFEVPKNRKVRVLFHRSIQIHFRFPKIRNKQTETAVPTQVQYHYTSNKKDDPEDKDQNQIYSYTISW
ncbi:MAG: energy transducer TonB [Saprospiraceae bacterium]